MSIRLPLKPNRLHAAKKPVGLTYIGLSWDGGCQVKRLVYAGTRDDVRQRASHGVVWMLFDRLNS